MDDFLVLPKKFLENYRNFINNDELLILILMSAVQDEKKVEELFGENSENISHVISSLVEKGLVRYQNNKIDLLPIFQETFNFKLRKPKTQKKTGKQFWYGLAGRLQKEIGMDIVGNNIHALVNVIKKLPKDEELIFQIFELIKKYNVTQVNLVVFTFSELIQRYGFEDVETFCQYIYSFRQSKQEYPTLFAKDVSLRNMERWIKNGKKSSFEKNSQRTFNLMG